MKSDCVSTVLILYKKQGENYSSNFGGHKSSRGDSSKQIPESHSLRSGPDCVFSTLVSRHPIHSLTCLLRSYYVPGGGSK